MKKFWGVLAAIFFCLAIGVARADTQWSAADYDLYPGDFNGDGLTDMLYI